jgi:hypothetical protein
MVKRSWRFGSQSGSLPAITNPPQIPPNRVSPDSTRLAYTVAQLTPLIGMFDRCVVVVSDLSGVQAEWRLGDQTAADGATVIGDTVTGRWHVLPGGGAGSLAIPTNLTAGLSGRAGVVDGEVVFTVGCGANGDGGGAQWRFYDGVSADDDGFLRINASNGQWRMVVNGPVTIKQIGCKDDNATDCGAILNAYIAARMADAAGANVVIELDVPIGTDYYYLATTVYAPGGNTSQLRIRGHGHFRSGSEPYGRAVWSSPRVIRGSVFRLAEGVHGFSGSITAPYSQMRLENIAILGAGRGDGIGVRCINLGGNCQFSYWNLLVCNCYIGVAYATAVTCKTMQEGKFHGCFIAENLGQHVPGWPTETANTDSVWIGQEIQNCNLGVWMQGGYNLGCSDGLVQGCAQGMRFGGIGFGYGAVTVKRFHFEANGWYTLDGTTGLDSGFSRQNCVTVTTADDTLSGLAARNGVTPTAGQRVLVAGQTDLAQNGPYIAAAGAWTRADTADTTHAGCLYRISGGVHAGTIWQISNDTPAFRSSGDDLVIAQRSVRDWDIEWLTSISATGVHFERTHTGGGSTVAPKYNTYWDNSGGGLNLIVGSGVPCYLSGSCAFESVTIDNNAAFGRAEREYPTSAGSIASGSLNHDWGNGGGKRTTLITGPFTLEPPTNACKGAIMNWFFEQDGVGGHNITISGNLKLPSYSNTGNGAAKRMVITAQYYGAGVWYEQSVGAWG